MRLNKKATLLLHFFVIFHQAQVVALTVQEQCFVGYSIKKKQERVRLNRDLQAGFLFICIQGSIAPEPLELKR